MQRDSQDQCGSHTDSAFGGYSQYSQQDYSQPLSQSYSNVYSQPIGRSQAGEREYVSFTLARSLGHLGLFVLAYVCSFLY